MILTRFTEPRQKEKSPETLVYQGFQDFSHGASNRDSPDRGNVTKWQKGDCEARAARTCDFKYVVGNYRCLILSQRQNNSPDCFDCDR